MGCSNCLSGRFWVLKYMDPGQTFLSAMPERKSAPPPDLKKLVCPWRAVVNPNSSTLPPTSLCY